MSEVIDFKDNMNDLRERSRGSVSRHPSRGREAKARAEERDRQRTAARPNASQQTVKNTENSGSVVELRPSKPQKND